MDTLILKIIRIIAIIPFIGVLGFAIYNSINGAAFINSVYYGFDAFILTLIAFGATFWWLGLICIVLIIITSIILKKQK